jgi:predicted PurR-regulated permease PerM
MSGHHPQQVNVQRRLASNHPLRVRRRRLGGVDHWSPEGVDAKVEERCMDGQPPAVDRPPGLPDWFQTLGRGAWLLVGIAVLAAFALFLLGLISELLIPLIFAAILAAIFVPLVDRLERWHLPRWLGAPLVVVLAIGVVSLVVWMVVAGLLGREREILTQLTAGLDEAGALVGVAEPDTGQAMKILGTLTETLLTGLLSGLSSATVLIVGVVTGLFILLFLMKDWRLVVDSTSNRIAGLLGLPAGVGQQIVSDTVRSFRAYAWGLTIVGLMNAAVVGLGAVVLGVPLAVPIAIVTFVTSYIPFFGAFFAGAFAVVIALGANGLSVALAMLAITLLTNNTLQNLLEPVAFGKTLRLHPLVVMLVTTAGTLLFGVLGATLAAPVTAVALRTVDLLRATGMFAQRPAASGRSKASA